ncbi:MAG: hypothetical protein MUO62_06280 [Anaerolineales bacterium]|nr:hypothetical protein [Anaerolineales bacterium]
MVSNQSENPEHTPNSNECPNCSSTNSKAKKVTINLKTGNKIRPSLIIISTGVFIVFGLCILITALVNLANQVGTVDMRCVLPMVVISIIPSTIVLFIYFRMDKKKFIKYSCAACKYRWEYRDGEIITKEPLQDNGPLDAQPDTATTPAQVPNKTHFEFPVPFKKLAGEYFNLSRGSLMGSVGPDALIQMCKESKEEVEVQWRIIETQFYDSVLEIMVVPDGHSKNKMRFLGLGNIFSGKAKDYLQEYNLNADDIGLIANQMTSLFIFHLEEDNPVEDELINNGYKPITIEALEDLLRERWTSIGLGVKNSLPVEPMNTWTNINGIGGSHPISRVKICSACKCINVVELIVCLFCGREFTGVETGASVKEFQIETESKIPSQEDLLEQARREIEAGPHPKRTARHLGQSLLATVGLLIGSGLLLGGAIYVWESRRDIGIGLIPALIIIIVMVIIGIGSLVMIPSTVRNIMKGSTFKAPKDLIFTYFNFELGVLELGDFALGEVVNKWDSITFEGQAKYESIKSFKHYLSEIKKRLIESVAMLLPLNPVEVYIKTGQVRVPIEFTLEKQKFSIENFKIESENEESCTVILDFTCLQTRIAKLKLPQTYSDLKKGETPHKVFQIVDGIVRVQQKKTLVKAFDQWRLTSGNVDLPFGIEVT